MNIVQTLNNIIIEKEQRREPKIKNRFWATDSSVVVKDIKENDVLIGSCLRRQYFRWKGVPETNPPDVSALLKMSWGNIIHEFVGNLLKEKVKNLQPEVRLEIQIPGLKYPLSGRVDYIADGIGIEVKSSFGAFFFNKSTGILYAGARDFQLLQVLCYLKMNRKHFDEFRLLYIARDTGFMTDFDVKLRNTVTNGKEDCYILTEKYNPKTKLIEKQEYPNLCWSKVVGRWKELEGYLERSEMPPQFCKWRSKYPATYCSYFDICFPDFPKKKQLPQYDKGTNGDK